MLETGLGVDAPQVVHLEHLREIGNLHVLGRPVPRIVEQRLHELRDDPHPPLSCRGDDHVQNVLSFHSFVWRTEVAQKGGAVELGPGTQIRAAQDVGGLGDPVVRPTVDLPRDAPPDLETQPADRCQQDRVDAHAMLQGVQHRVDTLVDERGGAGLNADHRFRVFAHRQNIDCRMSSAECRTEAFNLQSAISILQSSS